MSSGLHLCMQKIDEFEKSAPCQDMISKLLIANRGEISCRAQLACTQLCLPYVAVYTEPDAMSLHVLKATESVCLGPSPKAYLDADRLIQVALDTSCDAIFPGYGFLSENPEFAERCEAQGIVFIGPTPDTMRAFSRKHTARALASAAGVPVLPGSELLTTAAEAVSVAQTIGLPVLLKATGGGGGIGIHLCRTEAQVLDSFTSASRQGKAAFGDSGVFIEKYVENARHIEVQIFGDGRGTVVTFPERECSIQRRHQKVVEETPSPFVEKTPKLRQALRDAARSLGEHVMYRSAGTVEFIVDDDTGKFYFLEVNTRLQVEHGITEMVSGVDLVAWQFQLQGFSMVLRENGAPSGTTCTTLPFFKLPPCLEDFGHPEPRGHAIEVRVCAEDPEHGFRPCTGTLGLVQWPDTSDQGDPVSVNRKHVRVDTWVETGSIVSAHYDSLLAKLMVHSDTNRAEAITGLNLALETTALGGVVTNLHLLRFIAASTPFQRGLTTTSFLQKYYSADDLSVLPGTIEVIDPGLMTTVQDWPGRTGLWSVGVPPSGPMDDASHRFANALVGNDSEAAALEMTLTGPTLKFSAPAVVAITGASIDCVLLNGQCIDVPQWTSFEVPAGGILSVGACMDGARAYLAIGGGGLDVPEYLGSKSTFPAGKMGGHQGRPLVAGDVLPLVHNKKRSSCHPGVTVPEGWRPQFGGGRANGSDQTVWRVSVLPGPQEAPDYFTEEDVATFYNTIFKVHHNSNRLGIRLEGPRPRFARTDGGEGGSHPSNVHDHVYAIGTVNYTGDMPVVLTVDGPSLGGFVCPATIITNDLWKMGQVRPGDGILFVACTIEEALRQRMERDARVDSIRALNFVSGESEKSPTPQEEVAITTSVPKTGAVLWMLPASDTHPGAQVRLAGDRYLFLEYGPMELDLNLRVRVHQLEAWIKEHRIKGIIETSPGVRSVMIEYDMRVLPLARLLDIIRQAEAELPPASEIKLSTRILHLPMAFDDKWTNEAISRYARSVRPEAPYIPSNISFIAANNGLDGGDAAVCDVIFSASYMVLGLGDVYLGAPCAVPLDPRHRLVVPKYNPARTYTPEGGVGIGGCYMCIYGMDSPGGYQLVGRTLPIWNAFTRAGPFEPRKPWLLRNFDQVRYFQVGEEELETMRSDFACGRLEIRIEHDVLDMREYNRMVEEVAEEVGAMKQRQMAAMQEQMRLDAEQLARIDSKSSMKSSSFSADCTSKLDEGLELQSNKKAVRAAVSGTVWETKVEIGQEVQGGETLFVLEAMKMEYAVTAPAPGRIVEISVSTGELVQQGAPLCLVCD